MAVMLSVPTWKEPAWMWQTITYYGALVLESAAGVFGIRLYEEPRYDVVARLGESVEIRRYAPRVAAEVDMAAADEAGRNAAFQLLFSYIAGANRAASGKDNIAMTAPVAVGGKELVAMTVPVQTTAATGAGHMRFFLPAKYTLASAPKPLDPRVRLVGVPEEQVAALRYAGSGADSEVRRAELIEKLGSTKWRPVGEAYTLFYDAPFTLPFLRRNEAAVAVATTP
ncbi:heme-binding protein [Bradyrhizobium sp.]|uniref:SOUL family heme-binding protein n=1 Tax=Bradyrhizobium sp. TaxID=376 RepID=UPI00344DB70C